LKTLLTLTLALAVTIGCGGELDVDSSRSAAVSPWVQPTANGYLIQFAIGGPNGSTPNFVNVNDWPFADNMDYNYANPGPAGTADFYKIPLTVVSIGTNISAVEVGIVAAKLQGATGDGTDTQLDLVYRWEGGPEHTEDKWILTNATFGWQPGRGFALNEVREANSTLEIGLRYQGCTGVPLCVARGVKVSTVWVRFYD